MMSNSTSCALNVTLSSGKSHLRTPTLPVLLYPTKPRYLASTKTDFCSSENGSVLHRPFIVLHYQSARHDS
eukprot:1157065-Pelagomonas_calceolata.AAC.19